MMNENSPICARLIPDCTASRSEWPVRNVPADTATTLPTITSSEKARIGPHVSRTTSGSIAIPTETKKMATKRSRIGVMRCAISSPSPDSATSEPAMKAPNATEYPKRSASNAAPNETPIETTTVVSGLPSARTARINGGIVTRPTAMRTTRKVASCTPVTASSPPESPAPDAIVDRRAMRRMAITSSTIRMPKTVSRTTPVTRCSLKVRATIVVLEIATIAPATSASIDVQPKSVPAV